MMLLVIVMYFGKVNVYILLDLPFFKRTKQYKKVQNREWMLFRSNCSNFFLYV